MNARPLPLSPEVITGLRMLRALAWAAEVEERWWDDVQGALAWIDSLPHATTRDELVAAWFKKD